MCTHNLCFEQKYKNNKTIQLIFFFIFTAVKKCCMLHGGVFVMSKMSINSKRILPAPFIIISIVYC